MNKSDKAQNLGKGVHDGYRQRAQEGGDVLFHCKIKGRTYLTDQIPLHMSLKVFFDKKDMDLEEIKAKVKEFDIQRPDPAKLKFSTKIFTSEKDGKEYFMLMIAGCPDNYEKFYHSFGNKGTCYKKFMAHVTIDQPLYDKINEEGLKPEEIQFDALTIEHGADNTVHTFEDGLGKFEALEKGSMKHLASALVMAGALSGAPNPAHAPAPTAMEQEAPYSSGRMLASIADVESSGGKDTKHDAVQGNMHQGEKAYGKYGLMPVTIRETIHMNKDLASKHKKALNLRGQDLHHYMQDNPGLEDQVAQRHLQRLEHHFGPKPDVLGYAWLQGIRGTNKALNAKQNVGEHWHVKKIKEAYGRSK